MSDLTKIEEAPIVNITFDNGDHFWGVPDEETPGVFKDCGNAVGRHYVRQQILNQLEQITTSSSAGWRITPLTDEQQMDLQANFDKKALAELQAQRQLLAAVFSGSLSY